jgi:hypothetical protein
MSHEMIPPRLLIQEIEKKRFDVIQMGGRDDMPWTGRLPEDVMRAKLANYSVDRRSGSGGFFDTG